MANNDKGTLKDGGQVLFDYSQERNYNAKIMVFGIGGGGCNAVRTMMASQIEGVDFIVGNTDAQALKDSPVKMKLQMD